MKRLCLAVLAAVTVALWIWMPAGGALAKAAGAAEAAGQEETKKAAKVGEPLAGVGGDVKQQGRTELPPGWKDWNDAERVEWKRGLDRAKNDVRKHSQERLDAALGALDIAARKGAPISDAKAMAKDGLDSGLAPADFDPLGKFVVARVREGLRGKELSEAIHQEVRRRQEERRRLRERRKQQESDRKPTRVESIHRKKGAGQPPETGADEEDAQKAKGQGKGKGKGRRNK